MARDRSARAFEAWQSLSTACLRPGDARSLVVRERPVGRKLAPVWPVSQVLAAAADLAELTGDYDVVERLVIGLRPYAAGDGYLPSPDDRRRYYDDNAWIGLCFAQLHLQTGEARWLRRARKVMRFVQEGQDPDGGMRWVEGRRARHTCSAAPAAQLALRLHLTDGSSDGPGLGFASRDARLARSHPAGSRRPLRRPRRRRWSRRPNPVDLQPRCGPRRRSSAAPGDRRRDRARSCRCDREGVVTTVRRRPHLEAPPRLQRRVVAQPARARRLGTGRGLGAGVRQLPEASLARGPGRRRTLHGRRHRQLRRHARDRHGRARPALRSAVMAARSPAAHLLVGPHAREEPVHEGYRTIA